MSYLFVDFFQRLDRVPPRRFLGNDLYTTSLNAQYENIKHNLKRSDLTFQAFCSFFFSDYYPIEYLLSVPALVNRAVDYDFGSGIQIKNVFIHSEALCPIVSQGQTLYFVGDITPNGSSYKFVVKGIELLDSSILKINEYPIKCQAVCAFTGKLPSATARNLVADFGTTVHLSDSVLTPNLLDKISGSNAGCPIKSDRMYGVMKDLDAYDEYLKFRDYYLDRQSDYCADISSYKVCDSYSITRQQFDSDRNKYDNHILDGQTSQFKREQIILDRKIGDAEEFPLIRIDIERNLYEISKENDKWKKPKFESWLKRFSRDSVVLSAEKSKKTGGTDKRGQSASFKLGERYGFCFENLPVDCSDLERMRDDKYKKGCDEIDNRYSGAIKAKVDECVADMQSKIDDSDAEQLTKYIKQLDESLDKDVAENSDEVVIDAFNKKVREKKRDLNEDLYQELNSLNANLDKVKVKRKGKNKGKKAKAAPVVSEGAKAETIEFMRRRDEINSQIRQNDEQALRSVDLRALYVERNEGLVEKKRADLEKQKEEKILKKKNDKTQELNLRYAPDIEREKKELWSSLTDEFETARRDKVEKETVRRYHIYYRPSDTYQSRGQIDNMLHSLEVKNLIYDDSAERAKLKRQRNALDDLKSGNLKNPYLAAYLFTPDFLPGDVPDTNDMEWYLDELNPSQRTAVRESVSNRGIYLLQGPPGTGKTQVIAEITAQLAKRGKKVLISSETHKAIDNVFERLPKVPEIRPLRLIPSQNEKKDTNYGIDKLTDNLYDGISTKLKSSIERMENFEATQNSFKEEMDELKLEYRSLRRMRAQHSETIEKIKKLETKINDCNLRLSVQKEVVKDINPKLDVLKRTRNAIVGHNFSFGDDLPSEYYNVCCDDVYRLLSKFEVLNCVDMSKVGHIVEANADEVRKEIFLMRSSGDDVRNQRKKSELKRKMSALRSEDDEPPEKGDPNYETYVEYRRQLIKLNESDKNARDFNDLYPVISSFLEEKSVDLNSIDKLPGEIESFKIGLRDVEKTALELVDSECDSLKTEKDEAEKEADKIRSEKFDLNTQLNEYREDDFNVEYEEREAKVKSQVTAFFSKFGVEGEYEPYDFDAAFELIENKWRNLKAEYDRNKSDYEKRVPVFLSITNYISREEVRNQDRRDFTKELCDCVNVFGITCTSSDRYTGENNDGLRDYNIEEMDIKKKDIDVVIIDEVSKSFFLEMLIPILYGKSVILVGDHRQLSPMYDLRFLRDEDIENLSEEYITPEKNKTFTELYERCKFKEIFESISITYRSMLNRQYRCHSHIMNVFNFFYRGGELKLGKTSLDDEKEHNLSVQINGNSIIDPTHHVYFVNCEQEERSSEESTSISNPQEADVAIKLLDCLNNAALKSGSKPSVGVICTYGDQATAIRRSKKRSYNGFSDKQDEKLIISTVDDFQGDERDIIIVSMVRNTTRRHVNVDFITHFERMNVAFSRARKLLIVLGSRKFLSTRGIIPLLPDLSGDHKKDLRLYPAYKEIIDYIGVDGRILDAEDVLENKDGGKKN